VKRHPNLAFLFVLSASLFQACAMTQQTPHMGSCGKSPNLELVSLTMFPDPLPEARKIDQWRAMIRSDSADLCQTTLSIAEAGSTEPITQEVRTELTLGTNEVRLYSLDNYRLSGKEICFEVNAYIDGKKVSLDAPRRSCARTIDQGWWSMR
jgi:hypothetical protein